MNFGNKCSTEWQILLGSSHVKGNGKSFSQKLWYVSGDVGQEADYGKLEQFLTEREGGPANRLYYLATAPRFFPIIARELGTHGMATEGDHWSRVVIEKPFGHDLESAVVLNEIVHAAFDEHQVYRIDHYLGKDTAQNILYFRFPEHHFRADMEQELHRPCSDYGCGDG